MIKKLETWQRPLPNNPVVVENMGMDNKSLFEKINELCDAVNTIQKEREAEWFEIQEWIGILEEVRKSVNVHEKQIDKLQMKIEPEKREVPAENVQDKFAEQRKWIGKLCRFWDKEIGEKVWGILGGIDYSENEKYPYWCDQLQEQYQCCEPVKPDSELIYHGE